MIRALTTLLAAAAIAVSPKPAEAKPPVEHNTARVFYGDLDLSKPAGVQTLMSRIRTATYQVCGGRPTYVETRVDLHQQCIRNAMLDALNDIGLPGMHERVIAENNKMAGR